MKKIYLLITFLFSAGLSFAQPNDLLSLLGEEETTDYTTATFKTTRIVNGHSVENCGEGVLDVKISHRFNNIRNGLYDMFGLDGATIRIGLDYGISDRLMVGFGRGGREKIIDGFAKYKLLRQSSGKRNMPVTLTYLIDGQIKTLKFEHPERDNKFSSRLYFTHQLLIARKFNERLSLQLMPTLVHRNLVATAKDKNDVLAIGAAGRIKITRRVTFNAEYYYVPTGQIENYANCLSVGFEIETGGHVFQLHFTNAQDLTYKGFITETREDWFFKDPATGRRLSGIRFGFNISRVFTLKKPKGLE